MILVFVVLGIIILVSLSMLIFKLSTAKLEIKKLHISNIENKVKVDFVLNIGIYFLNKIQIIKFTIDNYKISNLLQSGKLDINKFKQNQAINIDVFKSIKYHDFTIEYFKIEGYFSTFDSVLSSWIYAFIISIIPILISRRVNGKYINELQFLNINDNKININLKSIFSVKMVNIINILHYLKKKGGNNNGKSSNRRAYAYSNE